MKKKLVFFIYIPDNKGAKATVSESKILSLHFELLRRFHNVFDEAVFVLSLKKEFLGDKELIITWEKAIMELGYLNVRFKVEENTDFRESKALYEEVVNSNDNKGKLVFFGHSKGMSNEYNESLIKLICSMYYFALSKPEEITYFLNAREHVYYGFPFLTAQWNEIKPLEVIPKYRYYYYGTFFWINYSLLKEVMNNKKREWPVLVSRFYSENFPANTIEFELACSYRNTYALSGQNLHLVFDEFFDGWIKYLPDGEDVKKKFNEFVENVKTAAKI